MVVLMLIGVDQESPGVAGCTFEVAVPVVDSVADTVARIVVVGNVVDAVVVVAIARVVVVVC